MIDAKKMVKTNDFYDWYPEVEMASNGSTKEKYVHMSNSITENNILIFQKKR